MLVSQMDRGSKVVVRKFYTFRSTPFTSNFPTSASTLRFTVYVASEKTILQSSFTLSVHSIVSPDNPKRKIKRKRKYRCFSGGSKGGARDARPLRGPISFIFMQFLGKIWPNNKLAPPGKFWIPHCVYYIPPLLSTMKETSANPLSACVYTDVTRRIAPFASFTTLSKVKT